jgi:hypothetical protein
VLVYSHVFCTHAPAADTACMLLLQIRVTIINNNDTTTALRVLLPLLQQIAIVRFHAVDDIICWSCLLSIYLYYLLIYMLHALCVCMCCLTR